MAQKTGGAASSSGLLPLLLLLSTPLASLGAIDADFVKSIPGFTGDALPSNMYSGYLPVGETSGAGLGQLHYWLIESESATPSEDPLVLWLNGGPGSSSLIGLLNENGPIKVNGASLDVPAGAPPASFYNALAWTQKANVLWLEQPKGVGYSFCVDGPENCKNTDDNVGPDVHDFLVGFFEGFPEYKDRDFWITGESYGGTYIPLIMDTIDQKGVITTLKGAAIGNGCTEGSCFSGMSEEYADYKMYTGHSMISLALADEIDETCGNWTTGTTSAKCSALVSKMRGQAGSYNVYYLYDDCGRDGVSVSADGSSSSSSISSSISSKGKGQGQGQSPAAVDMAALRKAQRLGGNGQFIGFEESLSPHPPMWKTLREDRKAIREGSSSSSSKAGERALRVLGGGGSGGESGESGSEAWDGVSYSCGNDAGLSAFLGDESVMAALHVNKSLSGQYYHSTASDLRPLYSKLMAKGYKLVIYSGDADMCVPYTFSSWWTKGLGFPVADDWHPWESNSLHAPDDSTVGGYAIKYSVPSNSTKSSDSDNHFYFVTVKGSGHMVPQYKPGFALTFITNVLAFDF